MQVARRRMPWNLTRERRRPGDAMPPTTPSDLGHLGLGRQLDLAAGLLDRGDRRRRGARDLHFDLGLDLAFAKEAHAIRRILEQAAGLHGGSVDRLAGVEPDLVDRRLQRAETDLLARR